MKTPLRSVWSIVALGCPLVAITVVFTVGWGVADERLAMRIIGIGGMCFLLLALVALIGAFIRREKLRWITPVPFLVILAMFGLGISP